MVAGGWIADTWSRTYAETTAPLGLSGWQAAFIAVSLPGFLIGTLMLLFKEPKRGLSDGVVSPPDPKPFSASAGTLGAILPGLNWLNFLLRRAPIQTWAINLTGLFLIGAMAWMMIGWTNSLPTEQPILLDLGALQLNANELQWVIIAFGLYVILNFIQQVQLTDRPTFNLLTKSRSLVAIYTLTALQSIINYGCMAFTPSLLIRQFDMTPTEVGLTFGIIAGTMGIVVPLLSGPLSDWLNMRFRGGRNYVTVVSLCISPILGIWAYSATTPSDFFIRFICYGIVLTPWLLPVYAAFMDLVLPRMRGVSISLYILSMTIVGLGIGPYAVGLISDLNGGDIAAAIRMIFWIAPVIGCLTIYATLKFPGDAESVLDRARAAGETV